MHGTHLAGTSAGVTCFLAAAAGQGHAQSVTSVSRPGVVASEVRWEPDAPIPGILAVHVDSVDIGHAFAEWIALLGPKVIGVGPRSGVVVLSCTPGEESLWLSLSRAYPGVREAVQDRAGRSGFGNPPDEMPQPGGDPPTTWQLHDLWFLQNTGQTINSVAGTPGKDLNLIAAWSLCQGSASIKVAVFDSGIDLTHAEFDGRLTSGVSYVCGPGSTSPTSCCTSSPCNYGVPQDNEGHGTCVAGALGANADNGTPSSTTEEQYLGVDPSCTIVPVRTTWNNTPSNSITLLALQQIFFTDEWQVPPAHVVNFSYDFGTNNLNDPTLQDLRDTLDDLKDRDVVVVNLAGNGGINYACGRAPQAWNNTITVGATDNQDVRASFSGTGSCLDFMAPGWGIYTAYCLSSGCNTWYATNYLDGTSASSPAAAGVVSLLLAYAEDLSITLSWDDVYEALKDGAVPLGTGLPNNEYGWGRLDAYEVLSSID